MTTTTQINESLPIIATYYQSPALVGVLVPASLVLMCYIGYDDVDNWITSLSGIFGLGIVLFPCNSIFLFTKSGETQTDRKRIRNIIYRVCGYGMLALEIVLAVFMLCKVPKFTVMIIEILLLSLFGFAWLVKGRAFPFLNDKKEDEEVLPVR